MLTLAGLRKYNRYQAALGHFGLSLIVFAILGYLVYFCWYPQPLFSIDAGWQGMRILAFVDFVLGPCITLVIFNPKKKELFKDLAIIALIQVSALSYGTYHVYQSRPAFVVYADNGFYTMALSELEHFPLSKELLDEVSYISPVYKFMDIPREKHSIEYAVETDDFVNYEALQDIRALSIRKETPFYLLEEYLMDYQANIATINKHSYDLSSLQHELSVTDKELLNKWIENNPNYTNYSYTSFIGRFGKAIVKVDKNTGVFLDYIPVDYHDGYL